MQHDLIGRLILLPEPAMLQVTRVELPATLGFVPALLQALALLLPGQSGELRRVLLDKVH